MCKVLSCLFVLSALVGCSGQPLRVTEAAGGRVVIENTSAQDYGWALLKVRMDGHTWHREIFNSQVVSTGPRSPSSYKTTFLVVSSIPAHRSVAVYVPQNSSYLMNWAWSYTAQDAEVIGSGLEDFVIHSARVVVDPKLLAAQDREKLKAEVQRKKEGRTTGKLFYDAAVFGKTEEIEKMLSTDPKLVEWKDEYGFTALHGAAGEHRASIIELLVARGADVNAQTNDGSTPLHSAAYPEIVEALVGAGAAIDHQDDTGHTPLLAQAGEAEGYDVMEALLKLGADSSIKNQAGETAQDIANSRQEFDKVKMLERFRKDEG